MEEKKYHSSLFCRILEKVFRWRVVKSFLELFTSANRPVYRYFRGVGEEWRVFAVSVIHFKKEQYDGTSR